MENVEPVAGAIELTVPINSSSGKASILTSTF